MSAIISQPVVTSYSGCSARCQYPSEDVLARAAQAALGVGCFIGAAMGDERHRIMIGTADAPRAVEAHNAASLTKAASGPADPPR